MNPMVQSDLGYEFIWYGNRGREHVVVVDGVTVDLNGRIEITQQPKRVGL